jgi:hypothetical protein
VGAVGAQAISEALRANFSMRELCIDCNEIGDAGTVAIGEALKANTSLTKLVIFSRDDTSGAEILAERLSSNLCLTELPSNHPQLGAIVERNKALRRARKGQLASFLGATEDPSALLFEGWDVLHQVSRSLKRALLNLDHPL